MTPVNAPAGGNHHHRRVKTAISIVAGVVVLLAQAVPAAGPPASLTHYRCYLCHADHEALAGPAFADIAAMYRRQKDAGEKIATVIRTGQRSGAPWHMPPHPEISAWEAQTMAKYILSLKPPPSATPAGPSQ